MPLIRGFFYGFKLPVRIIYPIFENMKPFRNIALIAAILTALFFVFSEKQAGQNVSVAQNPTEFSREGLHALAFIQPESAHHVVSTAKTFAFSVARLAGFFEVDCSNPPQLKLRKNFLLQDGDRCQSVSLLLFPHHFFW